MQIHTASAAGPAHRLAGRPLWLRDLGRRPERRL